MRDIRAEAFPYDLSISGGDEWRMYIKSPEWALAASVLFWSKLCLRQIETRVVVSIGSVDFLADGNLNEADGAAFRTAGRHLAARMEEHERFELIFAGVDAEDTPLLTCKDLFTELVELLVTEWTEAQTRAVKAMLRGHLEERRYTQEEIAANWGPKEISRQTVGEHLKRAEWYRLERTLKYYHRLTTSEAFNS